MNIDGFANCSHCVCGLVLTADTEASSHRTTVLHAGQEVTERGQRPDCRHQVGDSTTGCSPLHQKSTLRMQKMEGVSDR